MTPFLIIRTKLTRKICLLLQVESLEGLANLDAIVAIEGVDGSSSVPQISPLRWASGETPGHPDVQEAIDEAITKICEAGKAAGILTQDEQLARHYLALGASFVAVGVDTTVLMRGLKALSAQFESADHMPTGVGLY